MSAPPSLTRAAILAVGSELLTPLRIDTNSLFITRQLNALGVEVVFKGVVGDSREQLATAIRALLARADLVVLSGGLGPTDDDVTREAVADVLGRPLAEDLAITDRLRARFAARGMNMPMPESNRRQAMVPAGARIVENARGSAPGLWLDHDGQVVLLLPGPPRELEPMLTTLAEGWLRERVSGAAIVRRAIRITGRIESQTDEQLQPLYHEWMGRELPVSATILAGLGHIELHLWATASSRAGMRPQTEDDARKAVDRAVEEAVGVLGEDAYSTDGRSLEQVVGDLLLARGLQIGAAESCTGGLLTSRLTDVPGSSRYVQQSVITYSNAAKTALLGVPEELIAEHGAVSEPVALAMADGIRARAGVDVGIGITGIAGPTGGTPEKPVGTVAIAAVTASATRSRVFRFYGEREQVKFQSSQAGLDMIRRMLLAAG